MHIYTAFILFIVLLVFLPDLYLYRRFMRHRINKSTTILHWIISGYFMVMSMAILFNINGIIAPDTNYRLMMFIAILGVVYLPKLAFCTFDLIFFKSGKKHRCIQYAGYLCALATFVTLLLGIHKFRFNFQKVEYEIPIENLPAEFDGYKIVQMSDLHLGTFTFSQKRLKPVIDSINAVQPDLIVFAGDIVNNFATECVGWNDLIDSLHAKDEKLAVLGNHDYGLYFHWDDEDARTMNQMAIRQKIRDFGFRLLLNESHLITRDSSQIAVVGVENWGGKMFLNRANLKKAEQGTDSIPVKILLSHDPTFWGDSIQGCTDIDLTLSGHTHAAQMGIDWKWLKWSPAKWKFKYWDGLYEENGQHLIVSRGLGCVAIPIRIGMPPQYSVITLRTKQTDQQ